MFKEEYILDLLSGHLTQKGYASIVGSIASMVRRYQWQKNIIVSGNNDTNWCEDDYLELSHLYFEWIISNDKLKYIDKVPLEYLSYYFTQMFISFVANRIKEEQQKIGISFQKCEELVKTICEEYYEVVRISNSIFVSNAAPASKTITNDLAEITRFLPRYSIKPTTKHYKPLVKMVVDDIMSEVKDLVSFNLLCTTVFNLLDQSEISNSDIGMSNEVAEEIIEEDKYDSYIKKILEGLTKTDVQVIIEYVFDNSNNISLSDLSSKYGIPKSTLSKKINDFKNKIFSTYMPENEADGESFIKKLAYSMDEMVN